MYKILHLLLITTLALPVFAYSVATTTANTTMDIESPRPQNNTPILNPTAQSRITNLTTKLGNRLQTNNDRLQNTIDKMNARLQIMESEGKNVEAIKEKLAQAQANLNISKTSLDDIDGRVKSFISSPQPKEYWLDLKLTYIAVKDNAISSQRVIIEAIELAKTVNTKAQTL